MTDARELRDCIEMELPDGIRIQNSDRGSDCTEFEAVVTENGQPWVVTVVVEANDGRIEVFVYDGDREDVEHHEHLIASLRFNHDGNAGRGMAIGSAVSAISNSLA